MQAVLVFILAVMWSVYLVMWLLSRRERRSLNSIATFHKHLAVLERAAPGRVAAAGAAAAGVGGSGVPGVGSSSAVGSSWAGRSSGAAGTAPASPLGVGPIGAAVGTRRGSMSGAPMTLAEARNRRRRMLTGLAALASVTAALAFVVGGPLVVVHVAVDVALVAYVALLVRVRRAAAERRSTVVYLPRPLPAFVPEPAYLQRSAN